jgi:hypothetical protein
LGHAEQRQLLAAAEDAGVEVLLTTDRRIRYQQKGRRVALVVLTGSTKWSLARRHGDRIAAAVGDAGPGSDREVEIPLAPSHVSTERGACGSIPVRRALRAHLKSLGISLRSATEPIDDTSTGKLMEGVLAAFAQFDNDVRLDRPHARCHARCAGTRALDVPVTARLPQCAEVVERESRARPGTWAAP